MNRILIKDFHIQIIVGVRLSDPSDHKIEPTLAQLVKRKIGRIGFQGMNGDIWMALGQPLDHCGNKSKQPPSGS